MSSPGGGAGGIGDRGDATPADRVGEDMVEVGERAGRYPPWRRCGEDGEEGLGGGGGGGGGGSARGTSGWSQEHV